MAWRAEANLMSLPKTIPDSIAPREPTRAGQSDKPAPCRPAGQFRVALVVGSAPQSASELGIRSRPGFSFHLPDRSALQVG
jgi:hypothetical protein